MKSHRCLAVVTAALAVFLTAGCSLLTADRTAEMEASIAREELYQQRAEAADILVREAQGISEDKRKAILAAGARLDQQYEELAKGQRETIEESARLDWRKLYAQLFQLREASQ